MAGYSQKKHPLFASDSHRNFRLTAIMHPFLSQYKPAAGNPFGMNSIDFFRIRNVNNKKYYFTNTLS